jgi:hypothetical protein
MLRTWTSSQYLGHANLKNALDAIKRSLSNVALSPVYFTLQPTTVSNFGRGGMLRLGTAATNGTFLYRIEDTFYLKGAGTASALITGDTTPCLLPHNPDTTVDQTAAYAASDITAGYYRAGVVLVDSAGSFSVLVGELTGRTDGVGTTGGARERALSKLASVMTTDILQTKAIVAFYVIGDGTNAFTSTSTLTISTDLDIYNCGGMALSTGVSTDGNQVLGML